MTQIKLARTEVDGQAPSAKTPADYGEVSVNVPDRKIFMLDSSGNPTVIADRIEYHQTFRPYSGGDIVVRDNYLWRAPGDIPAGAFNPADWYQIGSQQSDLAILTEPTVNGRNKIDTTGHPGVAGLIIQGDPGQTEGLLWIPGTSPNDGDGIGIDAQGFPNQRFGPSIFRVVQASHPFTARGQAAAHTGTAWALADASDPALRAIAIIEQIIDANTIVLRTGGMTDKLQSGAFAGGVMTAGALFYVSDTVPGQLTTTVSSIRPDPVLYLTSGTEAVVLVGSGSAGADYVQLTGDTMSGPLTMANETELRFKNADTSVRASASTASLIVKIAGVTAARFDESTTDLPYLDSVVTRKKGDARYLQLVSGGNEVFWGGGNNVGQHRLSDNDGGGNANIRFGHRYDSGSASRVTTQAGGSGVALEASVDGDEPSLSLRMFRGDPTSAVDDPLTDAALFKFDANFEQGDDVVTRDRGDNRYRKLADDVAFRQEIIDLIYPIGSLYISANATNPGTFLGGEWVAHAYGKALVGVGTSDGKTWTLGHVEGSTHVTLTESTLPAHRHLNDPPSVNTAGGHHHSVNPPATETSQNGRHRHGFFRPLVSDVWDGQGTYTDGIENLGNGTELNNTLYDGEHTHTLNIPSFDSGTAGSHAHTMSDFYSNYAGDSESHYNIQPSIGVHVWRRVS